MYKNFLCKKDWQLINQINYFFLINLYRYLFFILFTSFPILYLFVFIILYSSPFKSIKSAIYFIEKKHHLQKITQILKSLLKSSLAFINSWPHPNLISYPWSKSKFSSQLLFNFFHLLPCFFLESSQSV